MRIIFAGTPEFSVPVLESLIKNHPEHEVVAVYTQPDKAFGRGRTVQQQSAVKQCALAHNIPVFQPVSLRLPENQEQLKRLKPDLMIVVAYGLILPQVVLDIPMLGCINVHASLLPRWRGASPIQQAILSGDAVTGVSIMQMEAGLDTGPVFIKAACDILPTDTAGILHDKLAQLGAETLSQILPNILLVDTPIIPEKQIEENTCYAGKIAKQDGLIDWKLSAINIDRKVRAFNPWPIAYFYMDGEYVRVWEGEALQDTHNTLFNISPGTIIHTSPEGIDISAGENTIFRIKQLQFANAKKLFVKDYLLGHSCFEIGKIL